MPVVIWQLLVQVILIALNAFFAATEIALISLNELKNIRLFSSLSTLGIVIPNSFKR